MTGEVCSCRHFSATRRRALKLIFHLFTITPGFPVLTLKVANENFKPRVLVYDRRVWLQVCSPRHMRQAAGALEPDSQHLIVRCKFSVTCFNQEILLLAADFLFIIKISFCKHYKTSRAWSRAFCEHKNKFLLLTIPGKTFFFCVIWELCRKECPQE